MASFRVARPRGVSLRHGEVRLAEHDGRLVVVGNRHRQVLRYAGVVPARGGVRQRPGVVGAVVVLARLDRNRLRRVPVVHSEGQHVAAQRGSRQAQVRAVVSCNGDRDAVRGPGGQLHGVARPRGVSLRHGEVRLAEHDGRLVVVGNRHRQVLRYAGVVPARGGVRQRPGVVGAVVVLARLDRHRLRRVPVVHSEGQHVAAQRGSRQAQVRAVVSCNGDRDAVRGPGGQLHGVARPRGVSLRHGEVRLAEHDGRLVVVGNRHRQVLRYAGVVPARGGVRQRPGVVGAVVVLARLDRHRLRNVFQLSTVKVSMLLLSVVPDRLRSVPSCPVMETVTLPEGLVASATV